MARILCVDDEAASLAVIEEALKQVEHETIGVRNVEAALNVLGRGGVELIVCDYRMPEATGLEFLSTLEKEGLDVPLIMITGFGSIEHAVASIKAGAVDYITKPARPQQLQLAVDQALELVRLRRENAQLREEVERMRGASEVVGDSPPMLRIFETLSVVAPTRATILLQGESGTGKELLARTLHQMSDRSDGPFIPVNAAALPEVPSNGPTSGPSSWMRSRKCGWISRRSFSVLSRNRSSSASVEPYPSAWMSESLQPRTVTWPKRLRQGDSERISFTDSAVCPSGFPRFGNGWRISLSWSTILPPVQRSRMEESFLAWPQEPSRSCSDTLGREMFGSLPTKWRGP